MVWFAARTEQARIAASGRLRPEWAGRSRRQRRLYRHPSTSIWPGSMGVAHMALRCKGGRDRIECAHFAEISETFFGSLGADPSCTTQTLRGFQRASFGRNEYLGRGGAGCGSRSWQRVPWEVISAGGWPRLDMTWRSLRAARIATQFAKMVSR